MEMIILALIGICILILCFVIFILGRIFENAIITREIEDKLDELSEEFIILSDFVGDKE